MHCTTRAAVLLHEPAVSFKNCVFIFCTYYFALQGEEGGAKKSILDVDPEAQALMEIAGKTMHSQGLREPEDDQEWL